MKCFPMLSSLFALASISVTLVFVGACGGGPGGTVGAECSQLGSSDECESDEICDSVDQGFSAPAYCLAKCTVQGDCVAGEECNGVTGSNEKACHPKEGDD